MTGISRPVPYQGLHPRLPYRAGLLHTNGGGTDHGSLYGWWLSCANGSRGPAMRHIGAHYQVPNSGVWERYVDPALVVYHAYGASEWAFGIETEDESNPATPWNDNQLAAITEILTINQVPGVLLTSDQPAHGVGYHQQFPSWNQEGHNCPAPVRVQQLKTEIIPALQGADMPLTDQDITKIVESLMHTKLGSSGPNVAVALQQAWGNTVTLTAELAALKAAVGSGTAGGYTLDQIQAAAAAAVRQVLSSVGGTA